MRISALDIRACQLPQGLPGRGRHCAAARRAMECLVYTLHTEDGQQASMLGFAGRSAKGTAATGRRIACARSLWGATHWTARRPCMTGAAPIAGGTICPAYAYGPLDCCLWLLASQAAGQPLWRYIGGARDRVPVYASSLVLQDAGAYADEARAVQAAGLRGL
ncbi:MAG: hypothetical protein V9G14_14470 [Cypionkella sp.]